MAKASGIDSDVGRSGTIQVASAWSCNVFAPGDVLSGNYEVRALIGEGGMGQVFEAHDRGLNRVVALKAARHVAAGVDGLTPLRREAQALAAVRHPGVVAVLCLGRHGDVEYIVMERIYGTSLEQQLAHRRRGGPPFTIAETLAVLLPLAEALAVVHAAGLAHRDVKPSNIMLAPGERLVLMDLGISLPEFESPCREISGTPAYMAPEIISQQLTPGAWHMGDLYSLGVVAFELLTGRVPFAAQTTEALLALQLHEPAPPVASHRAGVPAQLAELIAELLAKDPRNRPASAEAVLWRLRGIRDDGGAAPRALTVLIVDDDQDALALIRAAVRRAVIGVDTLTARSAAEALNSLQRITPDLMLLDLQMPEMSGLELCMYLRGMNQAARYPIISVSSSVAAGDAHVLRALGVTNFVPKGPHMAERLAELVRGVALRSAPR